jgi:hypothetical protein
VTSPPALPEPPAWLRACRTCAALHAAYAAAAGRGDVAGVLAADADLSAHLVAAHLAALPAYADGCPTCAEWRAVAPADVAGHGAVALPLADADLRHRAAHLYAPTLGGA